LNCQNQSQIHPNLKVAAISSSQSLTIGFIFRKSFFPLYVQKKPEFLPGPTPIDLPTTSAKISPNDSDSHMLRCVVLHRCKKDSSRGVYFNNHMALCHLELDLWQCERYLYMTLSIFNFSLKFTNLENSAIMYSM